MDIEDTIFNNDLSNSLDKNAPTYDRLPEEYMKEAQFVLDEVSKSQLFSSNRLRQNAIFSRQGMYLQCAVNISSTNHIQSSFISVR